MSKSLLMCLGKYSKDWKHDDVDDMAGAYRELVRREDLKMTDHDAGRKVLLDRIAETETEIAQIERVIEAYFEKKGISKEGLGVAKPVKAPPRAAEELEKGKEERVDIPDAHILKNAGLSVAETLTKPKKAGKKPRPVFEVSGNLAPYAEIIRELGGRKWGGKYSFWEDPTADLIEAIRKTGKMSFAEQMKVKQERAEGKADRLTERAEKAKGRAGAARKAEEGISGAIPMGQPILVGHHSEKRARRDQARIQKLTRDQITETDKAKWLEDRAMLQRDVAKGEYSLTFMQNRVDKTEADIRRLERILSGEHYGADAVKDKAYRERIAKTLADAQEKLEYWKEGIEAAGGISYSKDNLKKGDRIKIRGAWCTVIRANPKTVSFEIVEGGAKGMKLKAKYSEITDSDIEKPAAAEVAKPAEKAIEPAPKKPVVVDKKQKGKAASLRKAADSLQKQIDEKRSPAISQQNLTARRANIASSMAADADRLERIQTVMRGLADDTEKGVLPDNLQGIGTKAQIEQILTTKRFSPPGFHKIYIDDLLAAVKGVKGMADARFDLANIARRRRGEYQVDVYTAKEIKSVEAAIRRNPSRLSEVKRSLSEGKRILALGITDQQEYDAVRDKLLEYTKPPSSESGMQAKIREKEAALIGVKIPGFFPTPATVASKMVQAAEIKPGDYILEPSAGKGDLAAIIKEAHPENAMQVAEIGHSMREILDLKGFDIIGHDFLDMVLSKPGVQGLDVAYDKIIMNPPFEHFQDIDHVRHAYELLASGGRIVALMSESAFFRSEKKAVEFREWLDKLGADIHKLADKSFTGKEAFRQTGTAVRMVVIDKPGKKAPQMVQESAPKPWGKDFPNVISHTNANKLQAHPDHEAAKKGHTDAAIRLVRVLFKSDRAKALALRHPDAILVSIHSEESKGKNKIPQVFAEAISSQTGLDVDTDIVQTNLTAHTDKTGLQRLLARAKFAGEVQEGRNYIIIDDVITQGGTVSELKQYIERNGGIVVEVSSLACAQYANTLTVNDKTVNKLIDKYGRNELENILQENGIPARLESLTQSEARHVALYKGPDSFRAAIAKERQKAGVAAGKKGLPGKPAQEVKFALAKPVREMTWMDAKHIKTAMLSVEDVFRKVFGIEGMANIKTELKPFIDISTINAETYQRSFREHGGDIKSIAGLTTIDRFRALVQIVYTFDQEIIERTAYHEALHVASKWLLPNEAHASLMKHFKGNEENVADAFAGFAMAQKGFELKTQPNFIRAIFIKLRQFFQALRNALNGKGFSRPEDVFGRLLEGQYKLRIPASEREARLDAAIVPSPLGAAFSSYDKGKYSYEISCVDCDDVEALDKMIDDAQDITYDTFIKNVDAKQLSEMFDSYDWGPGRKGGLRLKDDWAVSFHKSKYQGRTAYYIQHSAIEYIFTRPETYYSKLELPVQPLHSQLLNVVEEAKDMPLKPDSLLNWLKKRAKPEEIKWLDIEEWVKSNVKDGKIDRDAFIGYVKDHQITVHEVLRAEAGDVTPDALQWSAPEFVERGGLYDEGGNVETYAVDFASQDVYTITGSHDAGYNLFVQLDGSNEKEHLASANTMQMAEEYAEDDLFERHTLPETRYDSRTLEGGTDYKELLFVYPPMSPKKNFKVIRTEGKFQIFDEMDEVVYPHTEPPGWFFDTVEEAQAKAMELNWQYHKYGIEEGRTVYEGPHWNESDVMAHARFNIRKTEDGNKVLFVEEIQSDWHQTGKDVGYAGETLAVPEITIVENTGQLGEPANAKYWAMVNGVIIEGGRTEAVALESARHTMAEMEGDEIKQPPVAPFAKTWHELVMKRMLRWAAENNIDTMAWTTGKQQIERYDLRHHIDLITWRVTGGGLTSTVNPFVQITGYQGEAKKFTKRYSVAQGIDQFLGKKMSRQIRDAVISGERRGVIEGEGLIIGGKGMESFYDELLPGFMKKYGKQWKASVGKTKVVTGREHVRGEFVGPDYTLEELVAFKEKVKSDPFPPLGRADFIALDGLIDYMKSTGATLNQATLYQGTHSLAEALGGHIIDKWEDTTEEVHSVDITQSMREAVLFTGQTMFAKAPESSEDRAWAQQYIADILADAADNPDNKETQEKAERIRVEQAWFEKEWPKAIYQSTKDVIKAFKMGKKEGWVGMRPDTTFLERWLQTPEFYYEKVPAAWRVFMASMERQDDKNQFYNDLTEKDVLLAELINFKKQRPQEYAKLGKLLVKADQIKATHGPKSLRKLGFSDQAINAFVAFRKMMDNGFDALYSEMAKIVQEYEEAGLDLPEVATWVGDKQILVNLKIALAEMGKMRGWYFPRQRKSGDWMLIAKKKGENPIMEIFELVGFANKRGNELKKQGYTVSKMDTSKLPEDVYQMAGKTISLNAMINMALAKTVPEKMPTFEEFGLTPIMRTGPTGRKDFIVRGPTNKETNKVMKALGGKFWSSAAGEPKAWHFPDAPSDMKFRVLRALITSKGIPGAAESDLLFAHALTTEVANVIKGRGFRSSMMPRSPETGKDVWLGYETDMLEVASHYVTGLSSGLAKKNVASKMVQAVTGTDVRPNQFETFEEYLDEVARRRIDPSKQKNIFHDVTTYIEEMLRNQEFSDRLIGIIKGATVLKYLGFRLASPLVNLTALVTSVPANMHALAGIPILETMKHLVDAMGDYNVYIRGDRSKLDADIVSLFDHIIEKGWDNAQYNMEALAVLRSKLGNNWKWLMEKSMYMFGGTEKLNRVATIVGTYKALKAQGKVNVKDMQALSKRVSDRGHGIYSKATHPYVALGKNPGAQAIQCLYIFSKFSHTYLQSMWDVGYKRHQWQSLLWMAASPAILAGAGSIPFVWPAFMAALREIIGVDEPEERFYSWFDERLGDFAGNFIRYGLFGVGGYGVSLKGSLSIDPVESVPTRLPEILGAPGNVVTDLWDGGTSLVKGDIVGALKAAGPRVTGSMIQAYQEEAYGVTTRKRTPKFLHGEKMQPENFDTLLRFMNFNPAHMAKIKEQKWSEQRLVRKYRDLRSDIYKRIRGYFQTPAAMRSDREHLALLADIDEYNKRVTSRNLQEIDGISIIDGKSINTALKIKK